KITERSNNELTFIVPEMTTGEVQIVFVTPDGTRIEAGKTVVDVPEIDFATFAKDEQQTGYVTWPFNFSWGDSMGKMRIFRTDLQAMNLQAGKSKIIVYKTAGITGQIQVNNANWGGITTIADWDGSAERIEWVVDDAFIDAINNIQDGWSDTALILQGDLQGVKKMTILP
ncbi:MAG: polygalacturonase, partial [Bacteroidales bacterium]|nr:polygalacturonase [Bacteroidales bacterium]